MVVTRSFLLVTLLALAGCGEVDSSTGSSNSAQASVAAAPAAAITVAGANKHVQSVENDPDLDMVSVTADISDAPADKRVEAIVAVTQDVLKAYKAGASDVTAKGNVGIDFKVAGVRGAYFYVLFEPAKIQAMEGKDLKGAGILNSFYKIGFSTEGDKVINGWCDKHRNDAKAFCAEAYVTKGTDSPV